MLPQSFGTSAMIEKLAVWREQGSGQDQRRKVKGLDDEQRSFSSVLEGAVAALAKDDGSGSRYQDNGSQAIASEGERAAAYAMHNFNSKVENEDQRHPLQFQGLRSDAETHLSIRGSASQGQNSLLEGSRFLSDARVLEKVSFFSKERSVLSGARMAFEVSMKRALFEGGKGEAETGAGRSSSGAVSAQGRATAKASAGLNASVSELKLAEPRFLEEARGISSKVEILMPSSGKKYLGIFAGASAHSAAHNVEQNNSEPPHAFQHTAAKELQRSGMLRANSETGRQNGAAQFAARFAEHLGKRNELAPSERADKGAGSFELKNGLDSGREQFFAAERAGFHEAGALRKADSTVYQIQKLSDEILSEIVKHLGFTARRGGGEANIVLQPEFLGNVRMSVKLNGSEVSTLFMVDSQAVKDLISSRLTVLEQGLLQQGFNLGSFSVEVRDNGFRFHTESGEAGRSGNGEAGTDAVAELKPAETAEPGTLWGLPWLSRFVNVWV